MIFRLYDVFWRTVPIIHVKVFWIIANCCKSAHNKKCPKLNGTKKCNSKKWEI